MDRYGREKEGALAKVKEGYAEREQSLQNTIRDLQSKLEDSQVCPQRLFSLTVFFDCLPLSTFFSLYFQWLTNLHLEYCMICHNISTDMQKWIGMAEKKKGP
jgi:hypothetical protein